MLRLRKTNGLKIITAIIFAALSAPSLALAMECNLDTSFTHKTKHHGKRPVYTDKNSVFFTAPMAVNTDGAPISYHPDDPWGNTGKAINTICNGANVILPNGKKIRYDKCTKLIEGFKEAKASGWENKATARMDFYGIASSGFTPCINDKEPYEGYFVSTTSVIADKSKAVCDQDRYLNSIEIPFAIYPGAKKFTSHGVGKRDVVVYFNPENSAIEFGIIGDRGPKWGLAEGSIAFAQSLRQTDSLPTSRKDTYNFGVSKVHGLILPNASLEPPYTAENVRTRARNEFNNWGGMDRLNACIKQHGG